MAERPWALGENGNSGMLAGCKATTGRRQSPISMEDGKVKSGYPIIKYEYAIVNSSQYSSSTAKNIRSLLEWIVNMNSKDGNSTSYLNHVHFQALPAKVVAQSLKQIKKIQ